MSRLWQVLLSPLAAARSSQDPHWGETIRLHWMCSNFCRQIQLKSPPSDPSPEQEVLLSWMSENLQQNELTHQTHGLWMCWTSKSQWRMRGDSNIDVIWPSEVIIPPLSRAYLQSLVLVLNLCRLLQLFCSYFLPTLYSFWCYTNCSLYVKLLSSNAKLKPVCNFMICAKC